ncbi:MAG: PH domain-containing protein [Bacteroidota bacterium]
MTLLQRSLLSIPAFALLLIPFFRSGGSGGGEWFNLIGALVYGFIALPAIIIRYIRFRYWITPTEIIIHSGVFTTKKRNIPVEKVQNVEIEQSLLPRLFRTAKIQIYTAGSTTAEGVMEYVGLPEAHRIRETIRVYQQRADAVAPAPALSTAVDEEPAPAEEGGLLYASPAPRQDAMLFEMPLALVIRGGMYRFSLIYIALAFSVLQYLDPDPDVWVAWLTRNDMFRTIDTLAASPWVWGSVLVLTAALLSWLTGILVYVSRYYGFQLSQSERKIHKKHGLLTLAEGTIPLRRIQAFVFRANWLMARHGWQSLELQTIGGDVNQAGHPVAVPFARAPRAQALANLIRPLALPDAFEAVSKLMIRRDVFRATVILGLLAAGIGWFWRPGWGLLALLPLAVLFSILNYRHHGYALTNDYLMVRRGVLTRRTWAIPIGKFQVFYTTATYFQRRLKLASVYVDTAGAGGWPSPTIRDLPAETAAALVETLNEQFQAGFAPDAPAMADLASDATPAAEDATDQSGQGASFESLHPASGHSPASDPDQYVRPKSMPPPAASAD